MCLSVCMYTGIPTIFISVVFASVYIYWSVFPAVSSDAVPKHAYIISLFYVCGCLWYFCSALRRTALRHKTMGRWLLMETIGED